MSYTIFSKVAILENLEQNNEIQASYLVDKATSFYETAYEYLNTWKRTNKILIIFVVLCYLKDISDRDICS